MNYQNKYLKYKKKYFDLQKGGVLDPAIYKTVVWKLESDDDIKKWNEILRRIRSGDDVKAFWNYGRVSISSSGLARADVESKERINPHIAIVIKQEIESLNQLYSIGDDTDLLDSIFGFVPFSVMDTDNQSYKLVLPMGLQKTPTGYGITSPEQLLKYAVRANRYQFGDWIVKPGPDGIKGLLNLLFTGIKDYLKKNIVIITRFSGLETRIEHNTALQRWSKNFPNRFKIGWGANYANFIHDRGDQTSEDANIFHDASATLLIQQGIVDTGNPTKAFEDYKYNPNKGGIFFQQKENILTIKQNDGTKLFSIKDATTFPPLTKLLMRGHSRGDGILITAWDEILITARDEIPSKNKQKILLTEEAISAIKLLNELIK
jgi:hypothetical protein